MQEKSLRSFQICLPDSWIKEKRDEYNSNQKETLILRKRRFPYDWNFYCTDFRCADESSGRI